MGLVHKLKAPGSTCKVDKVWEKKKGMELRDAAFQEQPTHLRGSDVFVKGSKICHGVVDPGQWQKCGEIKCAMEALKMYEHFKTSRTTLKSKAWLSK